MHDEKLEGALLERFCSEWILRGVSWSKIFSFRLDSLGWVFSLGSINRGSSPLLNEALSSTLRGFFFLLGLASTHTHSLPHGIGGNFLFSSLSGMEKFFFGCSFPLFLVLGGGSLLLVDLVELKTMEWAVHAGGVVVPPRAAKLLHIFFLMILFQACCNQGLRHVKQAGEPVLSSRLRFI